MAGESRDGLLASLREHVRDERVLAAMASVPRERFVPRELREHAYANEALPIGRGATISQPQVVAHMCALLDVRPGHRVLDVGTGSGYHAAVLAELGGRVWSIERDPVLSRAAALALDGRVELLVGDGSLGWPDAAPYDAINVAAAAQGAIPSALLEQLAPEGRLVLPVGEELVVVRTNADGSLEQRAAGGVRFVPLIEPG